MILKRSGGFIPGIRPGKETGDFLDKIMSLITLPGSVFLSFIGGIAGNCCKAYGCTGRLGNVLWRNIIIDYGRCCDRYSTTSKFIFVKSSL